MAALKGIQVNDSYYDTAATVQVFSSLTSAISISFTEYLLIIASPYLLFSPSWHPQLTNCIVIPAWDWDPEGASHDFMVAGAQAIPNSTASVTIDDVYGCTAIIYK